MLLSAITSHYDLHLNVAAPASAVYSMLMRPELHCELAPLLESVKTLAHSQDAAGRDQHTFFVRYRFVLLRYLSCRVELRCEAHEHNTGTRIVMQSEAFGGRVQLRSDYRLREKSDVTAVQERFSITTPKLIHRWAAERGCFVHQGLLNGIKYRLEHERIMTAEHVRPFTDHTSTTV